MICMLMTRILLGRLIQAATICTGLPILMTWILLRAPHTSSQDLHGVAHADDLGLLMAHHTKAMIYKGVLILIIWILLRVARTSTLQTVSEIASYRGQCAFKMLTRPEACTSFCNIHHRYENPLIKLLHWGLCRCSSCSALKGD